MIKRSALNDKDIYRSLQEVFYNHDSVSLDYEGDEKYLTIGQLADLLDWLQESFSTRKTFLYTISIRSRHDILDINKEESESYIKELLELYGMYNNFKIILVAGNKKYIALEYQKQKLKKKFEMWIEHLTKKNRTKTIHIGADGMVNLTKEILRRYGNTKAILLKSPNLKEQMNQFGAEYQTRLGVYALLIETVADALTKDFVKSYLQRRGIKEENQKEKVLDYAVKLDHIEQKQLDKYNFMFVFVVESI